MLELEILGDESLDEETSRFIYGFRKKLLLEHSLVSLSRWESKYEKPFLNDEKLSQDELKDYIRYMYVGEGDFPEEVFPKMSVGDYRKVSEYLKKSNTATFFKEVNQGFVHGKKMPNIITSELIYYWLVGYQIPFDVETWNLNRVMTLLRICEEKSKDQKKRVNKREMMSKRRALNERRLAGGL